MTRTGARGAYKNRGPALTMAYIERNAIPEPMSGCWLWEKSVLSTGYGCACHPGGKREGAHRVSWRLANGADIPAGMDICHRCDNRCCVNPDHLFVGSRAVNMRDCVAKGRHRPSNVRGEQNGIARLQEAQVRAIKGDARGPTAIAADYGVNPSTVLDIQKRRTWRHVQ